MADSAESTSASLFRASKRRKVFRKRTADGHLPAEALGEIESHGIELGEDAAPEPLPVVRRPAPRKPGIGFASGGVSGDASNSGPGMELAMVPVAKQDEAANVQTDRFMKPTGKVVIEDKHLTAYVDSKLAELRSSTRTPVTANEAGLQNIKDESSAYSFAVDARPISTTTERNTVPGTSSAQRPAQSHSDRTRQKPRRRQPQIDPSATAREAMVDRIMQESQVPMYDRPSASATTIDSDEAAAEAFKAEFLASLAEQNRRKPTAPPPAARGAASAAPATGPKLGGSRSQREKMKALEEAKGAAGRKR